MLRTILTILGTLAVVAVAWLAYDGMTFSEEVRAYNRYASALRSELAFEHGSPYVTVNGKSTEVFTLHPTSPTSPFARAGVVSGDIVFDEYSRSIPRFYMELEASRGKVFRFRVTAGGDGPPLRERSQKLIEVAVPSRGN